PTRIRARACAVWKSCDIEPPQFFPFVHFFGHQSCLHFVCLSAEVHSEQTTYVFLKFLLNILFSRDKWIRFRIGGIKIWNYGYFMEFRWSYVFRDRSVDSRSGHISIGRRATAQQ